MLHSNPTLYRKMRLAYLGGFRVQSADSILPIQDSQKPKRGGGMPKEFCVWGSHRAGARKFRTNTGPIAPKKSDIAMSRFGRIQQKKRFNDFPQSLQRD